MSDELLVSQPEPDRTFSSILSDARMIIGASIATLHRTDLATKRVLRVASAGAPEPLPSPSWTPLGVGLVGRCAYSGEPYLSTDIEKDPRGAHYWALKYLDVHAAVAVPLTMQRTTIGVLGAMHPRPGYFTSEHTKQLLAFAHDVAPTIQKLWSWQDRGASLSQVKDPRWLYELRLERVRQISAMIHSLDDIEQVYECALDAIAELTWAARVFIALVDEEAGVIRGHRGVNAPPELLAETVRRLYSAPSPDEDILAYVVRTREPAFTRLGDRRLNAATAARHGGSRYALTVPLIGRSGVLGTLTAGWNHETLADPALIGIVTILADHVAAAMDTHRLLQSERRQRLIAEELNVVARRITAGLSLEDSLTAVLRAVERLLGAVSSSVYLAEPSGLLPERRYTTRYTGQPHWEDRRGLISANGPTATALKTGQAVVIDDLQNEPEMRRLDSEEVRTTAAVPIHHDDRIIGVLYANWRERRHCAPADIRLLETLATYGAVAIENARLHTHLVEKARLEEANRRAREAEEERRRFQEFVAMASHDLKGPLSIALGYAQLLRQQACLDNNQLNNVAVQGIEKAARRMSRLMNDLLDAARIGAGGFEVQPAFLDLIDVTRQVVEEQQATTTAHRLLLEGPERLEGMWDGQRISQVLANLISNAIKYSRGGDVCISVRPACGEVIIAVSDQGPGIDPADVSRLFQPFVRIHNARPTAGSGLGLYIAKGIVESHAGRIWVDSEPGKGSTFLIALPL